MAMDWPTAADDGVKTLYHYQSANLEWLARTLFKGDIRFSNPKEFNDPWDCQPAYKEVNLEDPKDIKHHVDWLVKSYRNRFSELPQEILEKYSNKLRQEPVFLKSEVDEIRKYDTGKIINRSCWMYCLSDTNNCPLMWAHYADNHKGICLGFFASDNEFSGARRVNYELTYPDFALWDESQETQDRMILTKSDDWKYEKEYRLIHFKKPEEKNYDIGYWKLPSAVLSSIHLGCQMSDETIKMIVAAVEKLEFRPDIIQMVRHPSKYILKRKCIYKGNNVRG